MNGSYPGAHVKSDLRWVVHLMPWHGVCTHWLLEKWLGSLLSWLVSGLVAFRVFCSVAIALLVFGGCLVGLLYWLPGFWRFRHPLPQINCSCCAVVYSAGCFTPLSHAPRSCWRELHVLTLQPHEEKPLGLNAFTDVHKRLHSLIASKLSCDVRVAFSLDMFFGARKYHIWRDAIRY